MLVPAARNQFGGLLCALMKNPIQPTLIPPRPAISGLPDRHFLKLRQGACPAFKLRLSRIGKMAATVFALPFTTLEAHVQHATRLQSLPEFR